MGSNWQDVVLAGLDVVRENLAHRKGFDDAVSGRRKDYLFLKSRGAFEGGQDEREAYNAGYAEGQQERIARALENR